MSRVAHRIFAVFILAPLPLWAGALTFTVQSEIHVEVGAPLQATEDIWCHVWLRTGPASSDLELTTLKAAAIAKDHYVCKPAIFFRWGNADGYKTSGANIVYGAYLTRSNDADGKRQITALGPSLYPPPASKTVMKLPVVTLHL